MSVEDQDIEFKSGYNDQAIEALVIHINFRRRRYMMLVRNLCSIREVLVHIPMCHITIWILKKSNNLFQKLIGGMVFIVGKSPKDAC
jgi:hypothetical protein